MNNISGAQPPHLHSSLFSFQYSLFIAMPRIAPEGFPSHHTHMFLSHKGRAKPLDGFFPGRVSSPFLTEVLCILFLFFVLCLMFCVFVFCSLSLSFVFSSLLFAFTGFGRVVFGFAGFGWVFFGFFRLGFCGLGSCRFARPAARRRSAPADKKTAPPIAAVLFCR